MTQTPDPPAPTEAAPATPPGPRNDPFIVMVTSHWLSLLGLFLLGTALISWLFVLPMQVRGHADNPYIGIVVFIFVPIIFFLGLALVPIGVWIARRRVRHRLALAVVDRRAAVHRLAVFLGATTLVNVVAGTQLTYRAVEHMESTQFCGQSCHVMTPEFRAHQASPHARVTCVECHVGRGVTGWVESKMNGSRQLVETVFHTAPAPVPSALETGRLVPARETCEQCHWPDKFSDAKLRVITKFGEDEANTQTQTVLMMMVGGSRTGGIHGRHFGNGIEIRYTAADKKRTKIPRVEYHNSRTGESRVYLAKDAGAEALGGMPQHTMQCVDCHNRPSHTFELPGAAVDRALAGGELPVGLPFMKKEAMAVLKAGYSSSDDAAARIPKAVVGFYKESYPKVYAARAAEVESAAQAVAGIYGRNVFPELKVDWGTYPNNLGHEDSPGCFRCHDDEHVAKGGATIPQDCSVCHEPVAMDEPSPEILKTLGLEDRLAAVEKK